MNRERLNHYLIDTHTHLNIALDDHIDRIPIDEILDDGIRRQVRELSVKLEIVRTLVRSTIYDLEHV